MKRSETFGVGSSSNINAFQLDPLKASLIIENIILQIPAEQLFAIEDINGESKIFKDQFFISAVHQFLFHNQKLSLSNSFYPELHNLSFNDISGLQQANFEDFYINITVFQPPLPFSNDKIIEYVLKRFC